MKSVVDLRKEAIASAMLGSTVARPVSARESVGAGHAISCSEALAALLDLSTRSFAKPVPIRIGNPTRVSASRLLSRLSPGARDKHLVDALCRWAAFQIDTVVFTWDVRDGGSWKSKRDAKPRAVGAFFVVLPERGPAEFAEFLRARFLLVSDDPTKVCIECEGEGQWGTGPGCRCAIMCTESPYCQTVINCTDCDNGVAWPDQQSTRLRNVEGDPCPGLLRDLPVGGSLVMEPVGGGRREDWR